MHLGLACLAIGVAGSSLGTQQHEATLSKGESIHWAGRDIRFVRLLQHPLPEKLVVQAELEVTADGAAPYTLLPAQEYYFLQNQWNTEVAIHSTWSGDFYTILHSGEGQDRIQLTVVQNPLMRWMWLAGWIVLAGTVPWFWPAGKRAAEDVRRSGDRLRETAKHAGGRPRNANQNTRATDDRTPSGNPSQPIVEGLRRPGRAGRRRLGDRRRPMRGADRRQRGRQDDLVGLSGVGASARRRRGALVRPSRRPRRCPAPLDRHGRPRERPVFAPDAA